LRSASLALLLVTAACAHVRAEPSAQREAVSVGGGVFHLEYQAEDRAAARQVAEALRQAAPSALRWGRFAAPVVVTIHPSHQALEAAARRPGYPWMRAWTRFASIDLQSPRTWSGGGTSDAAMAQLLAHELTHCVMYQAIATASTWTDREVPLWFREGMASVTAGDRRAGPRELQRFYQEAGATPSAGDPLTAPEPLYRSRSDVVYGAADSAFRFLLERYGEARIRRLLAGMGQGGAFETAFEDAIGLPVQGFERDFKRYVVWRGWQG
jgi:hypothetical protein